jgi:hypothetical protein
MAERQETLCGRSHSKPRRRNAPRRTSGCGENGSDQLINCSDPFSDSCFVYGYQVIRVGDGELVDLHARLAVLRSLSG